MTEPIRVAHVIGNWLGGGVESVVMNYYRNIDRNKVQFDFLCSESSTDIPYEEIEKLGGRVFIVPNYTKIVKYQKELKMNLKYLRNIQILEWSEQMYLNLLIR